MRTFSRTSPQTHGLSLGRAPLVAIPLILAALLGLHLLRGILRR